VIPRAIDWATTVIAAPRPLSGEAGAAGEDIRWLVSRRRERTCELP
jgi:hypothetical protein